MSLDLNFTPPTFEEAFARLPLVAILRGVEPLAVTAIADGLAAVAREAGPHAAARMATVASAGSAPAQLVASPVLAGLYRRALQAHGLEATTVDESATARGLWRIARQAGALPGSPGLPGLPATLAAALPQA